MSAHKSLSIAALAIAVFVVPEAAPAQRGFAVNTVLELDRPLRPGDFEWNEGPAPPGRTQIVVDLARQELHVYRGGVEIGRSSIIYGDDDKPTPTGTFPILQKKAHHISGKYGAPMPYSLWLTKSGVAIHGSDVDDRYATHGCVGVPEELAAILFSNARIGDRVLITRGWMRDAYGG